jgi:predicted amidohydrolase
VELVHLAAVQAAQRFEHYVAETAFASWIDGLTAAAVAPRGEAAHALVCFPETIGLPLALILDHADRVRSAPTAAAAVTRILAAEWPAVLRAILDRHLGPAAFWAARAPRVGPVYVKAFAEAARRHGAWISTGSAFLPRREREAALGEQWRGRVYNLSFLISPTGQVVAQSAKVNLTRGRESGIGLARARPHEIRPAELPFGKVATLICYDAFFESLVESADAQGARFLLQPSANHARWEGPWSADPQLVEGQEWWNRGLPSLLQGRANLRYGVNAMLVGKVFDLAPEGRSTILRADADPYLAVAADARSECVITATVEP